MSGHGGARRRVGRLERAVRAQAAADAVAEGPPSLSAEELAATVGLGAVCAELVLTRQLALEVAPDAAAAARVDPLWEGLLAEVFGAEEPAGRVSRRLVEGLLWEAWTGPRGIGWLMREWGFSDERWRDVRRRLADPVERKGLLDRAAVLRGELAGRACRRRRDLAGEVEALLRVSSGLPTEVIARELRARPAGVRELLAGDSRFVEVPAPTGRRRWARCWALASVPVPGEGTAFSGASVAETSLASSRALAGLDGRSGRRGFPAG